MTTPDDCPRHQCGSCGRFVKREAVRHGSSYADFDAWATGDCTQCGHVDVGCIPVARRMST